MIKDNKAAGNGSVYLSVAFGIICGVASILLLSLILSFVMTVVDLKQSIVSLSATLSFSAGGFLTGLIAAKRNKNKGLLIGTLSGFLMFLFTVLVAVSVTGGGIGAKFLIRLIATVVSSAFGGVIGVNSGLKRNVF